jgi:hypothetical protein
LFLGIWLFLFEKAMKKKKLPKMPKLRHGWAINPKTRVTPSKKSYRRKVSKKAEKNWVDELFD